MLGAEHVGRVDLAAVAALRGLVGHLHRIGLAVRLHRALQLALGEGDAIHVDHRVDVDRVEEKHLLKGLLHHLLVHEEGVGVVLAKGLASLERDRLVAAEDEQLHEWHDAVLGANRKLTRVHGEHVVAAEARRALIDGLVIAGALAVVALVVELPMLLAGVGLELAVKGLAADVDGQRRTDGAVLKRLLEPLRLRLARLQVEGHVPEGDELLGVDGVEALLPLGEELGGLGGLDAKLLEVGEVHLELSLLLGDGHGALWGLGTPFAHCGLLLLPANVGISDGLFGALDHGRFIETSVTRGRGSGSARFRVRFLEVTSVRFFKIRGSRNTQTAVSSDFGILETRVWYQLRLGDFGSLDGVPAQTFRLWKLHRPTWRKNRGWRAATSACVSFMCARPCSWAERSQARHCRPLYWMPLLRSHSATPLASFSTATRTISPSSSSRVCPWSFRI